MKNMKINKTCESCSKIYLANSPRQKICLPCRKVICVICGISFLPPQYICNPRKKRQCCSKDCAMQLQVKTRIGVKRNFKFTKETKEKMRQAKLGRRLTMKQRQYLSNYWAGKTPKNNQRVGKYMNIKRGWYDIDGKRYFFRSEWEHNYALYLNQLIKRGVIDKWEFEPDVFLFKDIHIGNRSYKPDFKVFKNTEIEYHEVKGWMSPKSQEKLDNMHKDYPNIKIVLIDQLKYGEIIRRNHGATKK